MELFFPELFYPETFNRPIPGTAAAPPKKKSFDSDEFSISGDDESIISSVSTSEDDKTGESEEATSQELEDTKKDIEAPDKVGTILDAYSSSFALPETDQCIVRVSKIIKKKELEIKTVKGLKSVLAMPKRLRDLIHVGTYVLIQPTSEESKYPAVIVKVIDLPYKRFYEANNIWPPQFVDFDVEPDKPKQKKKKKNLNEPESTSMLGNLFKDPAPELLVPTKKRTYKSFQEARKKKSKKPKTKSMILEEQMNSLRDSIYLDEEQEKDEDTNVGEQTKNLREDVVLGENRRTKRRMQRLKKILAEIGSDVIEPNNDNTTVTSSVETSHHNIVQHKDDLPQLIGDIQPWDAFLRKKFMNEKEMKKHIKKEIIKRRKKMKKQLQKELKGKVRTFISMEDEVDLPCGVAKGQVLTQWEELAGKYKIPKSERKERQREEEAID